MSQCLVCHQAVQQRLSLDSVEITGAALPSPCHAPLRPHGWAANLQRAVRGFQDELGALQGPSRQTNPKAAPARLARSNSPLPIAFEER